MASRCSATSTSARRASRRAASGRRWPGRAATGRRWRPRRPARRPPRPPRARRWRRPARPGSRPRRRPRGWPAAGRPRRRRGSAYRAAGHRELPGAPNAVPARARRRSARARQATTATATGVRRPVAGRGRAARVVVVRMSPSRQHEPLPRWLRARCDATPGVATSVTLVVKTPREPTFTKKAQPLRRVGLTNHRHVTRRHRHRNPAAAGVREPRRQGPGRGQKKEVPPDWEARAGPRGICSIGRLVQSRKERRPVAKGGIRNPRGNWALGDA